MANNKQMQEEFAYFGEIWNFFKKFYEVQEDDAYWDTMVTEGEEIMRRHDSPLCKAVVAAVIEELDRKYREIRRMRQNAT